MREALLATPQARDTALLGRALGDGFRLKDLLDEVSRHCLQRALAETGDNKTRAAERLGLASD